MDVIISSTITSKITTDTTPTVKSLDPANGALNVALNKVIMINFNKPIKLGSNPWVELKTSSGVVYTFQIICYWKYVKYNPNNIINKRNNYIVVVHSNAIVSITDVSLQHHSLPDLLQNKKLKMLMLHFLKNFFLF